MMEHLMLEETAKASRTQSVAEEQIDVKPLYREWYVLFLFVCLFVCFFQDLMRPSLQISMEISNNSLKVKSHTFKINKDIASQS